MRDRSHTFQRWILRFVCLYYESFVQHFDEVGSYAEIYTPCSAQRMNIKKLTSL